MRRFISYEFLYYLFWFSVAVSIYFVNTGDIRISEACSINLSLLALAVANHSNFNVQSEKVKEVVREHLLMLYDTLFLTAKYLESDLSKMADVYTNEKAIVRHLEELRDKKTEMTRLASRLSFFIDEKEICAETDAINTKIDSLIEKVDFYRIHDLPSVVGMVAHLKETDETAKDIKSGLKTSISQYQSILGEIAGLERKLVIDLTEGPVIKKLRNYRGLGKIKLTKCTPLSDH